MKIFLSYSWSNMDEADILDNFLISQGIEPLRDKRGLGFKDDIEEFMKQVRESDGVITLVSESYLKSRNCMYEVLQLLRDEKYKDRIIPVMVKGTKIYNSMDRVEFIKYWNGKYTELVEAIKGLPVEAVEAETVEIKVLKMITDNVGQFVGGLSKMLLKTFDELEGSGFKELMEEVEKIKADGSSIGIAGMTGSFKDVGNKAGINVQGNGNKIVNAEVIKVDGDFNM